MQSIRYFRENYKNVQNAAFALNSDGGYLTGTMDDPEAFRLQSAEKVYFSVTLTAKIEGDIAPYQEETMLFMTWLMQSKKFSSLIFLFP